MNSPFLKGRVRHPIIQAPMAGTATPALAAAVSNAGGLGSISIAAAGIDGARQMIAELHSRTDQPFNVNVFCHATSVPDAKKEQAWLDHLATWFAEFQAPVPPGLRDIYRSFNNGDDQLQLLLDTRPAVVSFHLGLPPPGHVRALQAAGIALFASATRLEEAQAAEAAGIDVVVAQGIEAGGHRGVFDPDSSDEELPTLALLERLLAHLDIPVIAAGGLMDGADIRTVLDRGAVAAQLGTAFVLCPESAANPAYRRMLASARARTTELTRVISGRPARGLRNRFMSEVGAPGHPPVPDFGIAYDGGKQLAEVALRAGCDEFSPFWAGQQAARARAMPAAELLQALVREYQQG
jgi:nitronate monooxygenase